MARQDEERPGGPPPTAPAVEHAAPSTKPARGKVFQAVTLIPFLAFTVIALAVLTSLKPYRIISGSMAPTADVGQRVFADHVGGEGFRPKTGDIIVFKAPGGARDDANKECAQARQPHTACLEALAGRTDLSFVKRVVGLPGDRLRIVHGHVIRNGLAIDEPYARTCDDEACNIAEFSVPAGHYFVLGDNRGDSSDSRTGARSPTTRSSGGSSPPTGRSAASAPSESGSAAGRAQMRPRAIAPRTSRRAGCRGRKSLASTPWPSVS